MAEEIEHIYVIPLKKNGMKSSKAAPKAVKRVKQFLTRHMKVEENNIWIDDSLNTALWSRGKYNAPSKIRVKAVKFEDGIVEAYLPELGFKKSRRELLKEEREKKEPILKKEEGPRAEEEPGEIAGTEDYEIAPTGDGDVKIKKKKAPKEKKEEKTKPTEEKPEKKPVKEKPAKPTKKSTKPKPQKKSATKKKIAKKTTKQKTTKKTASKSTTAKKKVPSKKKSG